MHLHVVIVTLAAAGVMARPAPGSNEMTAGFLETRSSPSGQKGCPDVCKNIKHALGPSNGEMALLICTAICQKNPTKGPGQGSEPKSKDSTPAGR
ncbi:uncharacterized protein PpBr36_10683 [Pyricularia pennisetigena]|uniref:uncharacterized protein n=1 Tax=Pyricularia pennisetigena TaxID=1578925 RepID=UPI00114D713C|nr:uncharacterized protein PpBr36_10683 [Pyricularia pennisetigena]TLS20829.1 hypothetical protein PpBr36_10683 [Pyricularia pennisetigena]